MINFILGFIIGGFIMLFIMCSIQINRVNKIIKYKELVNKKS